MEHAPSFYHYPNQIAVPLVLASPEERISTSYWWMLRPSWDFASKGTLSSSPTIKEQRPSRPLCWLGGCATKLSSNTLVFALQMITATLCHVLLPPVQTVCTVAPTEHAPSFYHFPNQIAVPLVLASPEERISTPYEWRLQPSLDSASKGTLSMQMITATLCHVLLPLVQTVCTVAPREHAPSSYNYRNKMAVPLVLASPEERITTSYYWMLQ
ncbi:hypothetical protein MRX96_023844 [Rhipicephalus microplus]